MTLHYIILYYISMRRHARDQCDIMRRLAPHRLTCYRTAMLCVCVYVCMYWLSVRAFCPMPYPRWYARVGSKHSLTLFIVQFLS